MVIEEKLKLFEIINDYFDKVYVLSLKRSHDRHDTLKNTLTGLKYEIHWGVDGKNLDYKEMENKGTYHPYLTKLFKKKNGEAVKNMSLPQIACSLSHGNILKDIIENEYNNALILEDDIIIDGDDVEDIKYALSELPDSWDLLYLGHHGANSNPSMLLKIQVRTLQLIAKFAQRFERLRLLDPEVIKSWIPRTYSNYLDVSGYHHGTYAYAVSSKGAQEILNFREPTTTKIDNLIADLCSYGWLNCFNSKKIVFYPNLEIPSTINDFKN
jgi:glycosyl transferase family 25